MPSRNFKRIRFIAKAMVISGDHCFDALTENISIGGLFIKTDQMIPVGKSLAVILYLPSVSRSSSLTANCVVVRKGVNGLAFQFKSLDHDTFTHLRTILTRKYSYTPPVFSLPTKP
jgi:hypothetical protein